MEVFDKLEGATSNWSLESDHQLLAALRGYSATLSNRAAMSVDNIDELNSDVSISQVKLRNIFNEFMLMSNTQFIENRVYDDDDDDEDEGDDEMKSSLFDTNIADPLVAMRKAYTFGCEGLKLFIDDETSNEEKIEDIFNIRPLPYIIGTKEFEKSTDAGLGDILEITEEPDDEDIISEQNYEQDNDSRDDNTATDNSRPAPPSGKPNMPPPPPPSRPMARDESDDSYDSRENSDDQITVVKEKPSSMPSLSSVLAAQIRSRGVALPESEETDNSSEAVTQEEETTTSFAERRKLASQMIGGEKKGTPSKVSEKLDNVEEEEEDDDIFRASNDDPYSLFGGGRSSLTNRKSQPKRDTFAGLFGDLDITRDRSDSISSESSSTSRQSISTNKRKASISALFGDSNDSSLFDEIPDTKTIVSTAKAANEVASNPIVKSVASDLFSSLADSTPATSKAKPAIRALGASDLFSGGLFGDDDKGSSSPLPAKSSNDGKSKSTVASAAKFASLFGDDSVTDSLFGAAKISTSTKTNDTKPDNQPKAKKSSLFDDDDDDSGLFGKKEIPKSVPAPKPAAISSAAAPSQPLPTKTVSVPIPNNPPTKANTTKSLFDDDDDDELFSAPKKPSATAASAISPTKSVPETKKPAVSKSLFDDADDDDSLFVQKKTPVKSVEKQPDPLSSGKAVSSPDSGSKDNSSPTKSSGTPAPLGAALNKSAPNVSAPKSLFDDDLEPAVMTKSAKLTEDPKSAPVTISTAPGMRRPSVGIPLPPRPKDDDSDEENDFSDEESPKKPSIVVPVAPKPEVPVATAPVSASSQPSNVSAIRNSMQIDPTKLMPGSRPTSMNIPRPVVPRVESSSDDDDDDDSNKVHKVSTISSKEVTPIKSEISESVDKDKAPIAVSEPNTARFSKNMGEGLTSRISGLDPSKIMMPGMAPPKGLVAPSTTESPAVSRSKSIESDASEDSAQINVSASMDRATVKGKRRAPAKKSMTFDDDGSSVPLPQVSETKAKGESANTSSTVLKSELPATPEQEIQTSVASAPSSNKKMTSSFFDDADDGDLFGSASKATVKAVVKESDPFSVASSAPAKSPNTSNEATVNKQPSVSGKTKSLFDDDESPDDFLKPKHAKSSKSLFGDDVDDPLFGGKKADTASKKDTKKSIFGDDDDDPLFGGSTKVSSSKKKSLFDD